MKRVSSDDWEAEERRLDKHMRDNPELYEAAGFTHGPDGQRLPKWNPEADAFDPRIIGAALKAVARASAIMRLSMRRTASQCPDCGRNIPASEPHCQNCADEKAARSANQWDEHEYGPPMVPGQYIGPEWPEELSEHLTRIWSPFNSTDLLRAPYDAGYAAAGHPVLGLSARQAEQAWREAGGELLGRHKQHYGNPGFAEGYSDAKAGASNQFDDLFGPWDPDKHQDALDPRIIGASFDPRDLGMSKGRLEDQERRNDSREEHGYRWKDDPSGMPANFATGWALHEVPRDSFYHEELPNYTWGLGYKLSPETVSQLQAAQGNPEAPVTIYRAVPHMGIREGLPFNSGDWVTVDRNQAHAHAKLPGLMRLNDGYPLSVYQTTVPAKHLYTKGNYDGLAEYGYHGPPRHGGRSRIIGASRHFASTVEWPEDLNHHLDEPTGYNAGYAAYHHPAFAGDWNKAEEAFYVGAGGKGTKFEDGFEDAQNGLPSQLDQVEKRYKPLREVADDLRQRRHNDMSGMGDLTVNEHGMPARTQGPSTGHPKGSWEGCPTCNPKKGMGDSDYQDPDDNIDPFDPRLIGAGRKTADWKPEPSRESVEYHCKTCGEPLAEDYYNGGWFHYDQNGERSVEDVGHYPDVDYTVHNSKPENQVRHEMQHDWHPEQHPVPDWKDCPTCSPHGLSEPSYSDPDENVDPFDPRIIGAALKAVGYAGAIMRLSQMSYDEVMKRIDDQLARGEKSTHNEDARDFVDALNEHLTPTGPGTYVVRSPEGDRRWEADDEDHAAEQHRDAFPEEPILKVFRD